MAVAAQVLVTAIISASLSGLVVWLLWSRVLLPLTEQRARELAEELTENARTDLTEAGEGLVPQFRKAVRDGIQDAFLAPPTDRISQTARGVTNAGVSVADTLFKRIMGYPTDRSDDS